MYQDEGGPHPDWNESNPGKELKKGDKILEVNGIRGDSAAMMTAITEDEEIKLMVLVKPA